MTTFDKIINELSIVDDKVLQLDQCMQFDYKLSRKVPLRYRIIAIGFARKYSLEELNIQLQKSGLAKLYARNLWEASLIFAFRNALSYNEWRDLANSIESIRENSEVVKDILNTSKFSINTLNDYIKDSSDVNYFEYFTKHKTKHIESIISNIHTSEEFINYIQSNIYQFSTVREKTRYYFCKYLYYYLERKIDKYVEIVAKGISYRPQDIMDGLSIFIGASDAKGNNLSVEEIRDTLEATPFSCGILYAEFNEFFSAMLVLTGCKFFLR